jgi:hypothetical protein
MFTGALKDHEVQFKSHRKEGCGGTPPDIREGITELQWAEIKLAKRSRLIANRSLEVEVEVEKWNYIWEVLFPKKPTPSSFYIPMHKLIRQSAKLDQFAGCRSPTNSPVKEVGAFNIFPTSPSLRNSAKLAVPHNPKTSSHVFPTTSSQQCLEPSETPIIHNTISSRTNTLTSFTEDDTESGEEETTGSPQSWEFSDFSTFSHEGLLSQD